MPRRSIVALVLAGLSWTIAAPATGRAAAPDDPPVVDDDFERAGGPVGDGWSTNAPSGPGPVVDAGRATQGEPSNFWENLVWSVPAAADALWIEVDVVDASVPVMLMLHHDGDATEPAEIGGYGMRWQPADQRVTVMEDGQYRGPHATSGGPYDGPHTLRAEWDGVDQLTFFVDGVQVMTWTDHDGTTLGGADRRHVGVMFPPTGQAVFLDAVRGGALAASAAASSGPAPAGADTTPATSSPAPPTDPRPEPTANTVADDAGTAPGTSAAGSPVVTDNPFVPERDLSDCVSAVPQPDCGSEARGGWRQTLVFGLVAVALAFVGWRITRTVRRNRRGSEAPGGR